MNFRIIPRLDVKGPNLVKGVHLEGLRVLGRPEEFAKYYYETGADELIYQDVVASLYDRNSLQDLIRRTAKEVFIPITVGGGIRSIDDIREVLRAGADKVSLNTAALRSPEFIERAARYFGSSTIVVNIEAIRQKNGQYLACTDNGREPTGVEVISWAKKAEELGAGEIIITSVDNEGTGLGFDYELTSAVSNSVSIPVIAHGGAGKMEDFENLINRCNVTGAAIASVFHYGAGPMHFESHSYEEEGNLEFLRRGIRSSKIKTTEIPQLKQHLLDKIQCIDIRT